MADSWFSFLIKASLVTLPWLLRRHLLRLLYGYDIHPSARIGFAWIYPCTLRMAAGSHIDHLTVAVNLDCLHLHESASIGRSNWITGFPLATSSRHFSHQTRRKCQLVLEEHASITKNHHIDCTSEIVIGSFATVAGYRTQMLTHSIDLELNRQTSASIHIGSFSFVGTNCVILGGSVLPDHSALGACSLLNKTLQEPWSLYAGQPAKRVRAIERQSAYFSRDDGFVW